MSMMGKLEPRIIEMSPQKVAVVYSKGDPNNVGQLVMGALFGSVFKLKMSKKKEGLDFKVTGLRARWPDAHLVPKNEWQGIWALPVPDWVTELPQKTPEVEVCLETWEYGTVAQILHLGPYSEEGPTIERLHAFIKESGYQLASPHEEEYLTRPDAKEQKTIIRYVVKR
jgi:hypothetical protein